MHCDSVAGEPDLFSLLQPPVSAFVDQALLPSGEKHGVLE